MKMKSILYIIVFAGYLLYGCGKKYDVEEQRYTWKSEAPLTIPYKTRLQRFEKGNQIRNFSFETGRTYDIDSLKKSFVIEGWQQVGKNVEWVDILDTANYTADEVFSGNRAIKIVRPKAYETDNQGDGILSEYIKVIPGNYNLSLYIRLKDVYPTAARLGTSISDAVDIRLLYYDRNKIEITSRFKFPRIDQFINASNKWLSFANYKSIQSFNWGEIKGKTFGFPFSEGDIPSEAHYVRLYVGLKGSGTMWVDSVNFSYTLNNFSIAERMSRFTDTTFVLQNYIVPAPRKYMKMESVIFAGTLTDKLQLPVIVVPVNADKLTLDAADLIKKALEENICNTLQADPDKFDIPVVSYLNNKQLEDSRMVISLGETFLINQFKHETPPDQMPVSSDAYIIYPLKEKPRLVMLRAHTSLGLYYAACTSVQMIDPVHPVFHTARISDYPDFDQRFYSFGDFTDNQGELQAEYAADLIRYKMNGAFYQTDDGGSVQNIRNLLTISQSDIPNERLFKTAVLPEYIVPDDTLLMYTFPMTPGNRDFIIKRINDPDDCRINGMINLMLPPVFNNQLLEDAQFEDLDYPFESGVTYLYSGSTYYSTYTDVADIKRFTKYAGSHPVFMDNSMNIATPEAGYEGNDPFYPGKARLFNLFEPYNNEDIRSLFPYLDTRLFYMNLQTRSEIDIIRLATAADFMWNSNSYDRDLSLWKVLVSRYGAQASYELINYADTYGSALEAVASLKKGEQASRAIKTGNQVLTSLKETTQNLSLLLGTNHHLVMELTGLNNKLEVILTTFGKQ